MRNYLGPRGKLIAVGVTLFSVAAAGYAGATGNPLGTAVCLLLGYIALILTGLWGLVKSTSRSILHAVKKKPAQAAAAAATTTTAGSETAQSPHPKPTPAATSASDAEPAQSLRAMVELLIRDKVALRADEERLAVQISGLTDLLTRIEESMAKWPDSLGSHQTSSSAQA